MKATHKDIMVTADLLNSEPSSYFVYGDNMQRTGTAGAAALRHHPRAIGFITKKAPDGQARSSFRPEEYIRPFFEQLDQLLEIVKNNKDKTYYISKLGAGLANKYRIWETIIKHNLEKELGEHENVVFCWESDTLPE